MPCDWLFVAGEPLEHGPGLPSTPETLTLCSPVLYSLSSCVR